MYLDWLNSLYIKQDIYINNSLYLNLMETEEECFSGDEMD